MRNVDKVVLKVVAVEDFAAGAWHQGTWGESRRNEALTGSRFARLLNN
jgi:hypothetical protein